VCVCVCDSKRAAAFAGEESVRAQYERGSVRSDGFGLSSLQRKVAEDPVIVYSEKRHRVVLVQGGGNAGGGEVREEDVRNGSVRVEWGDLWRNVDQQRTAWRCVTRVARLLWPAKRHDIIADIAVAARESDTLESMETAMQMVAGVWDLGTCESSVFREAISAR
jgi:hypothetical protein